MSRLFPNYVFEKKFQKIKGLSYLQPVEYVNNKKREEYSKDSFEINNWSSLYWENHVIERVKDICRFNSKLWEGHEKELEDTFNLYYKFDLRKERCGFSTTSLFDFEIFLICNGYTPYPGQLGSNGGRDYIKDKIMITIEYGGQPLFEYKFGVFVKSLNPKQKIINFPYFTHLPIEHEDFKKYLF